MPLDRLFALETFGIKLGLDNITRLCAALGHPERAFTSLHIAGTNGKGSVTAMVHASLIAGGIHAARYTSPHLVSLEERFVIGSDRVDRAALEAVAADVLDCADRLRSDGTLQAHPTFFEATTAIAFELFRKARVEVAVIEVGLGGRFDATNVLTAPVGAITSIGLDHQEYLGATLEAVAQEKAGIIKPDMTVVTGALPEEAMRVVRRVSKERGARVVDASELDVSAAIADGEATVTIETAAHDYGPVRLGLRGEHQIGNALVAVGVLEALAQRGIRVAPDAVGRGLSTVEWPARLEVITLTGGARVLLDAAHNADGAHALAAYLRRWHPERPPLVVGVMRDKDVDGILDALLPVTSSVVATAADTPRAMPAQELADRVTRRTAELTGSSSCRRNVHAETDPLVAVDEALAHGSPVCVAGSIFLVGAVREGLQRRAILR